jgi:heptosyltransferase-2
MTWIARIPLRVGTGYRWYSFLFNKKMYEHRKTAQRHELEYNLNLLSVINCPADFNDVVPALNVEPSALETVRAFLHRSGIEKEHRIVILHPGSGGSARDWKPENFGALGKRLAKLPNVKVVITGGAGEDEIVNKVQEIVGSAALTILNELRLIEYAALAKLSSLFISNSTGTIHIAAAVGTPVIGLYPQIVPLSAPRWGPYTENKMIFSPKNKPLDCTVCLREKGSVCNCMDSISVDEVYEAAVSFLTLPEKSRAQREATKGSFSDFAKFQ